MRFTVGNGTRNALLNRTEKDAAYKQTPVEHEEMLNKYVRPTDTPVERQIHLLQGQKEESEYPKYWNTDETPRRDLNPSSSFIRNVEVVPDMGITRLTLGNKQYNYVVNPDEAGDMLTDFSIGHFYNNRIKGKR